MRSARWRAFVIISSAAVLAGGCTPVERAVIGTTVGGTAYLSSVPASEVEQVYYLGVFDPRDQVPPTIYRVTVRGQASAISGMKFGSGWVPAPLIDTLSSSAGFADDRAQPATMTDGRSADEKQTTLQTGRRLMLFGPEGFREAPKDHRLVIVMGSSPDKFFSAIDQSLGAITDARQISNDSAVAKQLFEAQSLVRLESKRMDQLDGEIKAEQAAAAKGAL